MHPVLVVAEPIPSYCQSLCNILTARVCPFRISNAFLEQRGLLAHTVLLVVVASQITQASLHHDGLDPEAPKSPALPS